LPKAGIFSKYFLIFVFPQRVVSISGSVPGLALLLLLAARLQATAQLEEIYENPIHRAVVPRESRVAIPDSV
jgi:hypothetical protein